MFLSHVLLCTLITLYGEKQEILMIITGAAVARVEAMQAWLLQGVYHLVLEMILLVV